MQELRREYDEGPEEVRVLKKSKKNHQQIV